MGLARSDAGRSDAGTKSLAAAGAQVQRGTLEDLESLKRGAAEADGVIHTAFVHDFTDFAASCATDERAIDALAEALAGSDRPLIVTAGTMGITVGRRATEDDAASPAFPRKSEVAAIRALSSGVRAMVVRLSPSVHDEGDHGFVPTLVRVAREQGSSLYVDDGQNRWSAVHRLDAARLYRLALEKGTPGARFHGVADEGIPTREIAESISRRLGVPAVSKTPEEASRLLGFVGHILGMDGPTSSLRTQETLGWHPTQPGVLAELETDVYFRA